MSLCVPLLVVQDSPRNRPTWRLAVGTERNRWPIAALLDQRSMSDWSGFLGVREPQMGQVALGESLASALQGWIVVPRTSGSRSWSLALPPEA